MVSQIPLLSIICPAYNQEKFIAETLEGFVMQKTSFPFEIIVHDDASTDYTANIIKEYEIKFPHLFANIYQKENQFSKSLGNVTKIMFLAARGKYIAMCDGDDYWTNPNKLQKQVDFLDRNPSYALCFHQTKTLYENGQEHLYNNFADDTSFDFIDLIQRPFISTVSCVFRNQHHLPVWLEEIAGDWPLFLHVASQGKIYYMNECMAVYRRHTGGIWSSLSNDIQYNNTIVLLDKLDNIYGYKYHEYFEKSKQARYQIHYPSVYIPPKESLFSRAKRKLKAILISNKS